MTVQAEAASRTDSKWLTEFVGKKMDLVVIEVNQQEARPPQRGPRRPRARRAAFPGVCRPPAERRAAAHLCPHETGRVFGTLPALGACAA